MLHRWEKNHLLTLDSFKPYLILSSVDTLISGAAGASLEYGSHTGKGRCWKSVGCFRSEVWDSSLFDGKCIYDIA